MFSKYIELHLFMRENNYKCKCVDCGSEFSQKCFPGGTIGIVIGIGLLPIFSSTRYSASAYCQNSIIGHSLKFAVILTPVLSHSLNME